MDVTLPWHVQQSVAYAAAAGELREAAEVEVEAAQAVTDEQRLLQTWSALHAAFPAQLAGPPAADDAVDTLPPEWLSTIHGIMRPDTQPPTPATQLDPEAVDGPEYGA